MTKHWQAFHVHYSQLDQLILDFVTPFFELHGGALERCFWERHYAGGRNLRIRLGGEPESLRRIGDALVIEAQAYLDAHPSPDQEGYSEETAAQLLQREGLDPAKEDLTYRNNQVVEGRYPIHQEVFASPQAAQIVDDFRHDVMPLVTSILRDSGSRWRTVLQLYFVHSIAAAGEIKAGSVSWKSHWEGFAAGHPSVQVVERIRQDYKERREEILGILQETLDLEAKDELGDHPLVGQWWHLMRSYRQRVHREVASGVKFTGEHQDDDAAREAGEAAIQGMRRDSEFVRTMWSSERFLTAMKHESSFQVPRVLVNLFYSVLPMLGIRPIDKMVLCHHVHRAVEEHYGCDLLDTFRETVRWMEEREDARRADG
ncbi:MAG: lantibiotic dehydratase C-terminal domain-containing protein [Acidobacteriota bacterium]